MLASQGRQSQTLLSRAIWFCSYMLLLSCYQFHVNCFSGQFLWPSSFAVGEAGVAAACGGDITSPRGSKHGDLTQSPGMSWAPNSIEDNEVELWTVCSHQSVRQAQSLKK